MHDKVVLRICFQSNMIHYPCCHRNRRNTCSTCLIFAQMPLLAMLFDCGWLLVAIAPMFVWLSKVVIPGEEAFLARHFGEAYAAYLESTPRWLF